MLRSFVKPSCLHAGTIGCPSTAAIDTMTRGASIAGPNKAKQSFSRPLKVHQARGISCASSPRKMSQSLQIAPCERSFANVYVVCTCVTTTRLYSLHPPGPGDRRFQTFMTSKVFLAVPAPSQRVWLTLMSCFLRPTNCHRAHSIPSRGLTRSGTTAG